MLIIFVAIGLLPLANAVGTSCSLLFFPGLPCCHASCSSEQDLQKQAMMLGEKRTNEKVEIALCKQSYGLPQDYGRY